MERSTSPAGPAPNRPVDAADAVGLTVLLLAGPGLLACAAALLQTGTSAPAAELTRAGKLISVAGGGDTVAALNKAGVAADFTFISTAGGAFLEWMEGKVLPGVEALRAA